jgi:hypothetical protein
MNSLIKLIVDDSSYNAKIKNAASAFMNFASQIGGAKGQFGALTKAIQQSTVAQEALNAVIAKNPMGAVMSIATAAATKLVEKLTSVSEEQQKLAEAAEERAERERHENETVVNSAAKVLTEYELLRQKWATLSDEHAKSEWIKENQRKFKQLGMAVSDVKTAEDVFVNNTQAVCNALIARAKAEAYGELYKEQLKKKISNELNPTVDNGRLYVKQNRFKRDENAERMAGVTAEDMNLKTETYYKNGVVSSDTKFESYKQSGLDKLNAYRLKMARARKAEDDRNLEMLALGMSTNQQEYETGMRGLGIWDNSGGNNGGKGGRSAKVNVPVKPVYVPEEGTPDFVKAMISDLQKQVGKTKDSGIREGLLMDIQSLQQEYKSMTTLPKIGDIIEEDDFTQALSPLQTLNAELKALRENLELAPDTSAYQEGLQAIADKEKEIKKFKGESDTTKVADESAKSWQSAASAVQSVGSALQNIEDPGAKVAGLIGQAIANIALGFAQATAAASGGGPVAWIAAIVGGMATMISTIEAIHSATGFSEGGMVQGSTFSGDKIPAMLNAGEVVLNRAQAGNLASQLQGGGLQNLHLEASVSGTQLRFVLNNESQVRGRGQYVTTNFRG